MKSIDEFDKGIIQALMKDARLSNVGIGELVKLSHSAVARRINRLEEFEMFERLGLQPNWARLGYDIRSEILITRSRNCERNVTWENILQYPNVLSLKVISGAYDFMGTVVAKNLEHYSLLIDDLLNIEGVDKIESLMVLRSSPGRQTNQLINNAKIITGQK